MNDTISPPHFTDKKLRPRGSSFLPLDLLVDLHLISGKFWILHPHLSLASPNVVTVQGFLNTGCILGGVYFKNTCSQVPLLRNFYLTGLGQGPGTYTYLWNPHCAKPPLWPRRPSSGWPFPLQKGASMNFYLCLFFLGMVGSLMLKRVLLLPFAEQSKWPRSSYFDLEWGLIAGILIELRPKLYVNASFSGVVGTTKEQRTEKPRDLKPNAATQKLEGRKRLVMDNIWLFLEVGMLSSPRLVSCILSIPSFSPSKGP